MTASNLSNVNSRTATTPEMCGRCLAFLLAVTSCLISGVSEAGADPAQSTTAQTTQTTQQRNVSTSKRAGTQEDWELKQLRQSADTGDASAQFILGERYANGGGVPQDVAQAVGWYRKAADQGPASAP